MNWIDLIIIGVVALATWRGKSTGLVRQLAGKLGLIAGFIIGTMLVQPLSVHLTHATWRPLLALALLIGFCVGGSIAGNILGSAVHRSLKALKLGSLDAAGGLIVAFLGSLVSVWLSGKVLSTVSWGTLATGVQHSTLLKDLNNALPNIPGFETKARLLLQSATSLG